MSDEKQEPKIGAGHASAMFRQGLAELRGALYPESNVAQPPQAGLYGTRTQGEVMQERGTYGRDPDQEPSSVLDQRLERAEKDDREREQKPHEMEKE